MNANEAWRSLENEQWLSKAQVVSCIRIESNQQPLTASRRVNRTQTLGNWANRKTQQIYHLIHWFGPEWTNYRFKNALKCILNDNLWLYFPAEYANNHVHRRAEELTESFTNKECIAARLLCQIVSYDVCSCLCSDYLMYVVFSVPNTWPLPAWLKRLDSNVWPIQSDHSKQIAPKSNDSSFTKQ